MTRYGGLADYFQAACRCRPAYVCRFCNKWLQPNGKENR